MKSGGQNRIEWGIGNSNGGKQIRTEIHLESAKITSAIKRSDKDKNCCVYPFLTTGG